MNKYTILIAVCLAVGIYAATFDEARAQLDKLADIASTDSEKALKQLNAVANTIRQLSQQTLVGGTRLLNQTEDRLNHNLQDILTSANALKVNITSCTANHQGLLRELVDVSELELVTCVDRYTNQATTATSQGLGNLNDILKDVFTLSGKLEQCKATDATCINAIVTQITFEEVDIPRRIQEQLDTATNKAEANRLYLSVCGLQEAESLLIHGGDALVGLQKCVDALIEGTTRSPLV